MQLQHARQFYIDGQWVDPQDPASSATLDVIDPSTATAFARVSWKSGIARCARSTNSARLSF